MKDIAEILQNPEITHLMLQAFQRILDNTDAMVFVKDSNLVYHAANMPFVHMVGKNRLEDVIEHTDFDIFDDPILAQRYVADDHRLIAENKDVISFIEPLPEENGQARFARTQKYILRKEDGKIIGLAGISRDVTQEIIAYEDHQKELSYLFALPDDAFMVICLDIVDWRIIGERQQHIQDVSFTMHEDADDLAKKACRNIVDRRGPAYLFYRDFRAGVLNDIYKNGRRNIVMEYLRRFDNGAERWIRDEIKLLADPSNGHLCLMLTVRDIHVRKQEEVKLLWAAERDGMTGILNRSSVINYAKDFLHSEGRIDSHALFVIDIDNFKRINDTNGHQAGDRFLTKIAHTIRDCFRDSDLIGRVGGDEFMVLMKHVPNIRVVRQKGQALLAALQTVCEEFSHLEVSGSIGVSLYDQDGESFESLYEKADQAMYFSKRNGKGQLFFSSDMPEIEAQWNS